MKRGCFNHDDVKARAFAFFGTSDVLLVRLLVYIDYCLKNGGRIDIQKMTGGEEELFTQFVDNEWIGYDIARHRCYIISKKFFEEMTNILWDAYVEKNESV